MEEICREQGIPEFSTNKKGKEYPIFLNERLKLLFEQENLSSELKEIIDGIKELANIGTHGSQEVIAKTINIDEAEIMLKLTDYVIERMYIDKVRTQKAINSLASLKKRVLDIKDDKSEDDEIPW